MKVVLTTDVKKLGFAGDIVEVAPGYARNFLFPKSLAKDATGSALIEAKQLQETRIKQKEEIAAKTDEIVEAMKDVVLTFEEKVSSETHLYGSVGEAEIVEALKKEAKIELEKSAVEMKHHIKELGEHMVKLHLPNGVLVDVKVVVKEKK